MGADGGGTSFPEVGLTVVPKKGAAVYFEYCNAAGAVDPLTLHAGMPVLAKPASIRSSSCLALADEPGEPDAGHVVWS